MTLKIHRASDQFLLLTDQQTADAHKFRIKLEDFKLYIRYVDLDPSIIAQHEREMHLNKWILLPFNKTIIKTPLHYPGASTIDERNLFFGTLPKTILIGLCGHEHYNGNYTKNPYLFPHLDATEIYIKLNGGKLLPCDRYVKTDKN
jgi:hypothetical protein